MSIGCSALARPRLHSGKLAISLLVGFGALPLAAVDDARLTLRPTTEQVTEGQASSWEIELLLPPECASVDVTVTFDLMQRLSTFAAPPGELGEVRVDGVPRGKLPVQVAVRKEGVADRLVIPVEIDTIDDALSEPSRFLLLDLLLATGVKWNLFCHRTSARSVEIGLTPLQQTARQQLDDNDRRGLDQPLLDRAAAPRRPRIVVSKSGRRVLVFAGRDELGKGVFAQLLDGRRLVGEPRRVGSLSPSDLDRAAVTVLPDGGFFVVRATSSSSQALPSGVSAAVADTGIVGRFFSPEGDPGQTVTIAEQSGNQGAPEVEADEAGNIAVLWQEDGLGKARVLSKDGDVEPVAVELGGPEPDVGASANGEFVTVWVEAGAGVFAQRFGEKGGALGPEIVVSTNASAGEPSVASNEHGQFVVSWTQDTAQGSDIFARRFRRTGTPFGAGVVVNQSRAGNQSASQVASNSSGDIAVVWETDLVPAAAGAATVAGAGVQGRFFSANDEPEEEATVAVSESGSTPKAPDVTLSDDDEVTVVVERQGPSGESEGIFEHQFEPVLGSGVCETAVAVLCLADSRFEVSATWVTADGQRGAGTAQAITADTGTFWFFDSSNTELVVKVLDACSFNDRFWVFAAGLTDVEVSIVVNDVISGETRTYYHPIGTEFAPVQDTDAFATCDASGSGRAPISDATMAAVAGQAWDELSSSLDSVGSAAASPLGLRDGRFQVDVLWATADGQSGDGQAVSLSDDTGYFWFFDQANVELLIKVLDGCGFNDHFWVFAGGLTNVETRIRVTDTSTGAVQVYDNPQSTPFLPVRDTEAFASCP